MPEDSPTDSATIRERLEAKPLFWAYKYWTLDHALDDGEFEGRNLDWARNARAEAHAKVQAFLASGELTMEQYTAVETEIEQDGEAA